MAISTFEAAKTLGELSGWTLTNLQMQKILYLAHMYYMGKHGEALVTEEFQAWDYGPVLPSLYHKIKFFGSDVVRDIFLGTKTVEEGTPEHGILLAASKELVRVDAARLVAYTHRNGGAWGKHYKPYTKNSVIPHADVLAEYNYFKSRN